MRMSAALALRKWDRVNACPAAAADNPMIPHTDGAFADDADFGQQKIREPNCRGADGVAYVRWYDAMNQPGDPHASPRD
jgi:hypothetical protein